MQQSTLIFTLPHCLMFMCNEQGLQMTLSEVCSIQIGVKAPSSGSMFTAALLSALILSHLEENKRSNLASTDTHSPYYITDLTVKLIWPLKTFQKRYISDFSDFKVKPDATFHHYIFPPSTFSYVNWCAVNHLQINGDKSRSRWWI